MAGVQVTVAVAPLVLTVAPVGRLTTESVSAAPSGSSAVMSILTGSSSDTIVAPVVMTVIGGLIMSIAASVPPSSLVGMKRSGAGAMSRGAVAVSTTNVGAACPEAG